MLSRLTALALQAGAPSCADSALHRPFDFWTGAWNVYARDGACDGSNVIEPGAAGCVLHEPWINASGGAGHSLD